MYYNSRKSNNQDKVFYHLIILLKLTQNLLIKIDLKKNKYLYLDNKTVKIYFKLKNLWSKLDFFLRKQANYSTLYEYKQYSGYSKNVF